MTIVAFDFGMRHIGVATGNRVTKTATALVELRSIDGEPRWSEIATILAEWRPHLCLVGLPLNMDDTESSMSGRAREFAEQLSARFSVEVHMVDERLTSFEAVGRQGEKGKDVHALSAQIIAETYLNDQGVAD